MRLVILILKFSVLASCATSKFACVEINCVHTNQAVTVDYNTQQMYRDAGYRVPIYIPPLIYPEEVRYLDSEASLVVEISIDKDGNVQNASIKSSSGNSELDVYAIEYVKEFKFESSVYGVNVQLQRVTFQLL